MLNLITEKMHHLISVSLTRSEFHFLWLDTKLRNSFMALYICMHAIEEVRLMTIKDHYMGKPTTMTLKHGQPQNHIRPNSIRYGHEQDDGDLPSTIKMTNGSEI